MPRIIGPVFLIILVAACAGTGPETGTLVVSIRLSGIDINTEHTVTVDEMPPKAIPADGSRELILPTGDHLVRIHGMTGNCMSSLPTVQPVSIREGEASHLDYSIACTASSGYVRLKTTTTGEDPDPDGYRAFADPPDDTFMYGTRGGPVGPNGQVIIGPVSVGEHDVVLYDLAANCTVNGTNPRRVTVPKGQLERETVDVSMEVKCTAKEP